MLVNEHSTRHRDARRDAVGIALRTGEFPCTLRIRQREIFWRTPPSVEIEEPVLKPQFKEMHPLEKAVKVLSVRLQDRIDLIPVYPGPEIWSTENAQRIRHAKIIVNVLSKAYELMREDCETAADLASRQGMKAKSDSGFRSHDIERKKFEAATVLLIDNQLAEKAMMRYINMRIKEGAYDGMIQSYTRTISLFTNDAESVLMPK